MSADHDPLCPSQYQWMTYCPNCDLIARVRADERQQARQRVERCYRVAGFPVLGAVVWIEDAAAAAGGDATPPPEDHPAT